MNEASGPDAPGSRMPAPPHTLPARAIVAALDSDVEHGLTGAEAAARRQRFGPNRVQEHRRRPLWRMFLTQLADFMILVLIAAALISGMIGSLVDTLAIVVIVLLNAVIGLVQEYRAERAMAALKRMAAPGARVRRDGRERDIPAADLVPGDVVLLEAGNVPPADLRLVEAAALQVDESALTGESQPVQKSTAPLDDGDAPPGERANMVFKGTQVTQGRATGVITATGMHTELGRIAALLQTGGQARTPLQQRLARFGRRLALAVLAICAVIFVAGLARGEPAGLMFLTAVSLAVAAIPEALPAVVTISLALGARKMARQHALIRHLPAVETLGSVTFICTDKTGTLTENRMRAEAFWAAGEMLESLPSPTTEPWRALGLAMALNNDIRRREGGSLAGEPTEVALAQAALAAGLERSRLEQSRPRIGELPFDAERKRMTTLHRDGDAVIAYTKGAPERVLACCTRLLAADGERVLDSRAALQQAEQLAARGYRVLAFARRHLARLPEPLDATVEKQLTLLGLVGLLDPPRPEAACAVELCRSAGITPVMVTGDHPATALAIARRLGIASDDTRVVTGRDLAGGAGDSGWWTEIPPPVFARVSPAHKIDIVDALQRHGQYVAMTGDGVNDAPALKRADIGVAMGGKGTDVAREAADMVLLDDNFATIVAAVREGRRIYDNVRKFIKYTMTSNAGEIWTLFLAPFLGLPIPLLPIHILWINLVTDGLPGLALTAEPGEPDLMRRPPRPPREPIFAHGMWQHILWAGVLIGGLSIFAQAWALHTGSAHWQTMVFTVLTLSQLVHALAIRSESRSLWSAGLLSNVPLLGALALTLLLQLATIYVPLLNPVFHTDPLTAAELGFCLGLPWVVLLAVEAEKWLYRRGWIYQNAVQ
jgi:Ca2+-transporting ATPase